MFAMMIRPSLLGQTSYLTNLLLDQSLTWTERMLRNIIAIALPLGLLLGTSSAVASDVVGPVQAEQARLRRHFAMVGQVMSAYTPTGLDDAALQNRRAIIAELGRYAERGVFPRNSRHPNVRRPYFIDDGDRACAVGHLMMASGYEHAARDIAASQNNAYVHGIHSAEVGPWLATHGLTLEEAALIQPGYCGCPYDEVPVCGDDGTSYLNECVARKCAGAEVVSCAACDPSDQLQGGALDGQGTLDDFCDDSGCACPDGSTGEPAQPVDEGGCSVHAAPTGSRDGYGIAALLGLLLAGGWASRRRRQT